LYQNLLYLSDGPIWATAVAAEATSEQAGRSLVEKISVVITGKARPEVAFLRLIPESSRYIYIYIYLYELLYDIEYTDVWIGMQIGYRTSMFDNYPL
jgi:hypothetical protein